jgi:rubredoxin
MACPMCRCKEHNPADLDDDDIELGHDDRTQRCAACGWFFDLEDAADDEDDDGIQACNPWKADIEAQTNPASAGDPGLF